jgi:hypothetical protein
MSVRDRDPAQGNISGEIPAGEVEDARDARDARTERVPAVKDALRVDAREARTRSQQGRHRK